MNTRLNPGNIEFRTLEDVRRAAMAARAEFIAETIRSAWRGLQRAGQWLRQHATAAPGSRNQSHRGCVDCP